MDETQAPSTDTNTTTSDLDEYFNELLTLGLIIGMLYKPVAAQFSNIRDHTHPPTPYFLYRLPPFGPFPI
ncbi:MAG: hypothetical protein ACM3NT_11215 [Methylocystaceae bacterium]